MISPLPETFRMDGFDFKVMLREGRVAMLRKEKPTGNAGYEVVIIQKRAACVMHGHPVPAHEAMPGNESWGSHGWSFVTREAADSKFHALTSRRSAPLYPQPSQPRHFHPQDTHCSTLPQGMNQ